MDYTHIVAAFAWGDNPPFSESRVFVLTHCPHEPLQRGPTTFIFVTAGMESALEQAHSAADGKNVVLMGADISQQYLKVGPCLPTPATSKSNWNESR